MVADPSSALQALEGDTMFNLSQNVNQWRQALAECGSILHDELDELESHLVDLQQDLVKRGMSEEEAFTQAVRQVGEPRSLSREFERTHLFNSKKLWRALYIAPLVAPVMLSLDSLVLNLLLWDPSNSTVENRIWMTPLLFLIVGVSLSYLIAATVWMPLVVLLKKYGWLHFGTVHLLGLLIACGAYALLEMGTYFFFTSRPTNILEYAMSILYRAGFALSNIMLSVLVFWLMIQDSKTNSEQCEDFLASQFRSST
jgi:hypothetical protein